MKTSNSLLPTRIILTCVCAVVCALATPFIVQAQATTTPAGTGAGFSRDGIFGCTGGEYAFSAGTIAAVGGVYVPVNDAAVTINTGYLVHKECTLDGIVRRIAESTAASLVRATTNAVNNGTDGSPQYVVNLNQTIVAREDEARLETLKTYATNPLCSPFRQPIRVAVARAHWSQTRNPENAYSCSIAGSSEAHQRFLQGDTRALGMRGFLDMAINPSNYGLGAYITFKQQSDAETARAASNLLRQIDWGQGFRPAEEIVNVTTSTGENRVERRTLTPGIVIAETLQQVVGSGFRQTENATEIDQIIGALFSGMSTHVVSDVRGLAGLTQAQSGSSSYLDRLTADASAGVRNGATNAGLGILNSTLTVETEYNSIKREILAALNNAAARLRATENRCWELIVPAVQQLAQAGGPACVPTPPTPNTCAPIQLSISTSSQRYIRDGALQLQSASGGAVSAGATTLQLSTVNVLQSGSVTLNATSSANITASQAVNARIAASSPLTSNSLSLAITPENVFSSGTLSLQLNPSVPLPVGQITIPLVPVSPFTVGALALEISTVRQFADPIINADIAPLVTVVEGQIRDSDNGLALLRQIVNDLQNSNSNTAQRLALERLDTLVSNRLVHSAFDLRGAQEQRDTVEQTLNQLVEETIQEWGSGSGWCNVENPAVVEMWLNRWRI